MPELEIVELLVAALQEEQVDLDIPIVLLTEIVEVAVVEVVHTIQVDHVHPLTTLLDRAQVRAV